MIHQTPVGIELDVRVIARARKDEVVGTRAGALLVRLAAPPVEGAANAALIELIAHRLDVPRKSVRIIGGVRARDKRLEVAGIAAADAARRLGV